VFLIIFSSVVSEARDHGSASSLFTNADILIPEAPKANIIELRTHPDPLAIPRRTRQSSRGQGVESIRKRQSDDQVVNTIFSGIYPVINVTWGNKDGASSQSFVSFIDTGQ
jgi:hypothetical protein